MAGLVETIRAMEVAAQRGAKTGLVAGARFVGFYARANHPYTNRTYRLQTNTRYDGQRGLRGAWGSSYTVHVVGDMFYGGFVELGTSRSRPYPYLAPAWEAQETLVVRTVEASVLGAVERVL